MRVRGQQTCGLGGGAWCADGSAGDFPTDQRGDDGRSLTFTSEPLEEAVEILGFPEVRLELAVDRPDALVAVRLCDVAPTGESLLVTRGYLNLTHRGGHESVSPLVPAEPVTVAVRLDSIAHTFREGHRVRVGVSPTYWPLAWPSPEPVTLDLFPGDASRLELPVRPARPEDAALRVPEPEEPEHYPSTTLRQDRGGRRIELDLDTGRADIVYDWDLGGLVRYEESGIEHTDASSVTYSIVEDDPLSARVEVRNGFVVRRGDWDTRGTATGEMTSTRTHFHVTTALEVYEAQTRVWARSWTFAIPRDGV